MDRPAASGIETFVRECEALLHALGEEIASPDGGEAASTLIDALIRKGGALREVCAAAGDTALDRAAQAVAQSVHQIAEAPHRAREGVAGVRQQLEQLRRLAECASVATNTEEEARSRMVAVVECAGEPIGVPLDLVVGARARSEGGLEIELRTQAGGGGVRALRLIEFASVGRQLVDGAGVWPDNVVTSAGRKARMIESASELAREGAPAETTARRERAA